MSSKRTTTRPAPRGSDRGSTTDPEEQRLRRSRGAQDLRLGGGLSAKRRLSGAVPCYPPPITHGAMIGLVSFRALERTDFPLLQQWLSAPHVDAWWHEPLDLRGLEQKYGPRIDGIEKVHVFIIEHEDRPIGWIQWYRWSDYPDHAAQLTTEQGAAGIDLAIGEVSSVGIGLGPIAIRRFVFGVVSIEPGIVCVVTDPEEENRRSHRAFEKAGFTQVKTVQLRGENVRRCVMRLSLAPSTDAVLPSEQLTSDSRSDRSRRVVVPRRAVER